jgi:hypothetical protein
MTALLYRALLLSWVLWAYQVPQGLASDPKAWTKLMVFNETTGGQASCETFIRSSQADPARRRFVCLPAGTRPWERP